MFQAKDKGIPSMNSTTTVEVLVIDTNDNPPVFTKHVYTAAVPENAFGGFQVCYQTLYNLFGFHCLNTSEFRYPVLEFKLNIYFSENKKARNASFVIGNKFTHVKLMHDSFAFLVLYVCFLCESEVEIFCHLQQVIRVTALDADEGNNAAVTYNIINGADGKFIIEGQIRQYFLMILIG